MCSGASSLLGKRGTPARPAQAHARRILGKGSMRPYFALFFCQLLSDSSARCLPFKSDLQPQGETNQVLQLFKECKHHSILWRLEDFLFQFQFQFQFVVALFHHTLTQTNDFFSSFARLIWCGLDFEAVVYNFMSLFTPLFSFPDQIFVLQHFPNCKAARIIKLSFTHIMASRSCSDFKNPGNLQIISELHWTLDKDLNIALQDLR